jgi:hypothetical protein
MSNKVRHWKSGDTQVRLIKVLSFFIYVNSQLTQLIDDRQSGEVTAKKGMVECVFVWTKYGPSFATLYFFHRGVFLLSRGIFSVVANEEEW